MKENLKVMAEKSKQMQIKLTENKDIIVKLRKFVAQQKVELKSAHKCFSGKKKLETES